MSEVMRHFPLTKEQENSLRELRATARKALTEGTVPVTIEQLKANVKRNIEREKLIGRNTLRFIVQHTVREQTGLSHWFNLKQFMQLDQLILNKRLRGV